MMKRCGKQISDGAACGRYEGHDEDGLGCVAAHQPAEPPPRGHADPACYRILRADFLQSTSSWDDLEEKMNELAREGFRFVSMYETQRPPSGVRVVMFREKRS